MTESEQARADAMADAETLRLIVETPDWKYSGSYRFLVELAQDYAEVARLWMLQGIDEHDDRQAYSRARMAARLAFRAMPGLREA